MKILQVLILILITQSSCFAYTKTYSTYNYPFINQRVFRHGVMTGIPTPIVQYNVPSVVPETYYIKRKHIKKKYRKYYPNNNFYGSY